MMIQILLKIFSKISLMNKAIRAKLNNFSKKQKTLDFNARSAIRPTNNIQIIN